MVHRRTWLILVSGFFEPLFYLLFFVYPLGDVIGEIALDEQTLEYAAFVAPALLAASAMNGAYYDATNVFWKLRYAKVYDAMLSTPISPRDVALGETLYAVLRAVLYSAAFLNIILVLGLVDSWWGLAILPACLVIGFGFAGAGIAAMTWMRSWQDFDLIQLVMLPDVPVRDDVLPALRLPRGDRVGDPGAAAVPRDRADPLALDRRGVGVPAREHRVPAGDGARRHGDRGATDRPCAPEVAQSWKAAPLRRGSPAAPSRPTQLTPPK